MRILGLLWHMEVGVAYTFSAVDDPQNPNANAACLGRDLDDNKDLVIAHRNLPCKSKALLYNLDNNRYLWVTVGDRGPYGKRKKGPLKGRYRGIVDMAPLVNRKLKARGEANVVLISLE